MLVVLGQASSTDYGPLHRYIADELALERTRLLYQGAGVPTLFMLLTGLACTYLLWTPAAVLLLPVWWHRRKREQNPGRKRRDEGHRHGE